jgi:lon-related putative ATP-dependent protease
VLLAKKKKIPRGAVTPKALKPNKVFRPADLGFLKAKSTKDLIPFEGVIEQKRPKDALELGIRVRQKNFHIFVAGPAATGKMTTTMRLLKRDAPKRPVPPDLIFLHNFDCPEEPIVVAMPPGHGIRFQRDMDHFLLGIRKEVPDAYHSKEHQERLQAIVSSGIEREQDSLAELKEKAAEHDFVVRPTKDGLTVLPVVDGRPLAIKEYADQPREIRAEIEERRKKIDPFISAFFELNRAIEKESQEAADPIQREMGKSVIGPHIERVKKTYGADEVVCDHLDTVMEDLLDHLTQFIPDDNEDQPTEELYLKALPRFRVNTVVDNRRIHGAPIIVEDRPNYHNLFGRIEKQVEHGIYSTDHTMLKAGSLLKANGGYLVINAADLLNQGGVWDLLKAALRSGKVRIEDIGEAHGVLATSGIRPMPVPVDVKIILIGSHGLFDYLYRKDEDFPKLFRVKAEFDDVVTRTRSSMRAYTRFVAGVCQRDKLLPVRRSGLETLVEVGSIWAEHQDRLSLAFNDLASLVIEADDVARLESSKFVDRKHVQEALDRREYQVSYLRDRLFDDLKRNHVIVDTKGAVIGTVNALSVFEDGPHAFGRPTRITARAQSGSGGVLNIEREARLSGQLHDKGMLILSGYLGGKFGDLSPLSTLISVCFEQSYGYVDGDSASMAETLAILSELACLPIRQDLAITGSMNQLGEAQAIGGVNSKIEGFHRLCQMRGLTGTQGVAIPYTNVPDLMLPGAVRADIGAGRFHVYPIRNIDQAVNLFFSMPAGVRVDDVFHPAKSVYNHALDRIIELHRLSDGKPGHDEDFGSESARSSEHAARAEIRAKHRSKTP